MSTKIRSSKQLYVDADLDINSKKLVNVASGTVNSDGINKGQMDTAIGTAVAGVGGALHVPVADLTAAVLVNAAGRSDKMIMLIETLGLYRFDAENTAVSNNGSTATVIRPTDVATDAAAGRWIKISNIMTSHSLLDGLQGNGEYHLSLAERDKLTFIEAGADITDLGNVTDAIDTAASITNLSDTDTVPIMSANQLFNSTWANIKAILKTYFDGFYQTLAAKDATGGYVGMTLFKINFKNAANTFTSFLTNANTAARTYTFADRDGTIADNTDITSAKARANHTGTQTASTISDFASAALTAAPAETVSTVGTLINGAAAKATPADADGIGISDSAASNVLKKFTFGNLKTWLSSFFSGDFTVTAAGVTAIGANKVTNAQLSTVATQTFKGRNTAATGNVEDLSVATVKTMLGLNSNNLSQRKYRIVPTGVINNSNTAFTIADLVISGTEEVFKNGMLLNAGAGNDYTITYGATTTITFAEAPNNSGFSDVILVNYSIA
ncbi:MAG: hypothetical protein ACOYLO_12485 [Ferruginibacter sp.]